MLLRSVSGVRFTIGGDTTPQIISKYIDAFATWISEGTVVIGNDGRPTGQWIQHIVIGTLAAKGISVINIGVAPTPTIQLAVKEFHAIGGISISASHNPQEWNGLKFLTVDGICLSHEQNTDLFKLVDEPIVSYPDKLTDFTITEPFFDNSSLLSLPFVQSLNLVEKIRAKKYHCVVDAVNASGSIRIPAFLESLGCTVVKLYCDESGVFPHTPEPISENLVELATRTKTENASIGIAVDPDADRLVLINEMGEPIGEEKTIALAAESILYFKQKYGILTDYDNAVSVNLSTSKMVEDVAKKYGATIHRSPVGEVNVVGEMKQTNSVIGGEGSGGVILPASHYGRDSFVGILLILGLMAEKNVSLSELSSNLSQYSMVKMKKNFQGSFSEIIKLIQNNYPYNEIDIRDGVKVYFENSWVHFRTSNTEPIVRCIAEAPTEIEAYNLATSFLSLLS
ncbi:MAG: phosphoglucosamine mutase [Candidatus Kapabacteria bacterium]|nr:phosphoglucosamine mutase [Candidatus Kapabacteria bacterium]